MGCSRLAVILMEQIAGRIFVEDVDELALAVHPWEMGMNQLSCGGFEGVMDFAQVHGILITRERWSNRLAATGATPAGYFALVGPCTERGFSWCGSEYSIDRQHYLACAHGASEVDFVTWKQEEHWVLLLPDGLIDRHLGHELASVLLPKHRSIRTDPRLAHRLSSIVLGTITALQMNARCHGDTRLLDALRDELLDAVADVLLSAAGSRTGVNTASRRFLACSRARRQIEQERRPIFVAQLAAKFHISRRTLEYGFRQAVGISPQKYSRMIRLNGLHRLLRLAAPEAITVTAAARNWGFTELGRAAGYYRAMFGESPSETLRADRPNHGLRFSDVLGLSRAPDLRA